MINAYCRILQSFCDFNALVIRLAWYCLSLAFPSNILSVYVCVHICKMYIFKDVFDIKLEKHKKIFFIYYYGDYTGLFNSVNLRLSGCTVLILFKKTGKENLWGFVIAFQLLTILYLSCVTEGNYSWPFQALIIGAPKSFVSETLQSGMWAQCEHTQRI